MLTLPLPLVFVLLTVNYGSYPMAVPNNRLFGTTEACREFLRQAEELKGHSKTPKYRAEAKVRAEQLAPLIRDFQKRGYSMRSIANELEKRKVQTPRGGSWHPQLVKRIMQRLDAGRPPDATWGIRVPHHNPTYRYKH